MTLEKIVYNQDQLKYAFHTKERKHLQVLADRANILLTKILNKTATDIEDEEYHALKYVLKEIGAIDKELLERKKRDAKRTISKSKQSCKE